MKGITICQPYAQLIISGEKRVENRTWPTHYRGPLLIHAGKSKTWLRGMPASPELVFGAVLGTADLIDCLPIDQIGARLHSAKYPWLRDHDHTEGPWCWVLANVRALATPIPMKGALGLWTAPGCEQLDFLGGEQKATTANIFLGSLPAGSATDPKAGESRR